MATYDKAHAQKDVDVTKKLFKTRGAHSRVF